MTSEKCVVVDNTKKTKDDDTFGSTNNAEASGGGGGNGVDGDNDVERAVPNWLKELEAKRETKKRLRARLGHEAGAGSPCLQCKDTCPGLDLHFWRKICKNCKCGKENHDVQDDDLHGWLQFQLLGSKSSKPAQKIRLPGQTELELEWAPKGSKEAVEKYFETIPNDRLPIKGSDAALQRKQLLQKQIPVHDVDPSMCHALTEEETRQMHDYVNHLKQKSVGVGLLVNYTPTRREPIYANTVTPPQQPLQHQQPTQQHSTQHPTQQHSTQQQPTQQHSTQQPMKKHDYENIDAFGNHKLAASLEEIQRQQQLLECGELLDSFGNPVRAQYAMLLDQSGLPLKDRTDKPIKATLDLFGHPIFDQSLGEKIGPLAKAFYAMLLDKNGAPILGPQGNPIKNRIPTKCTEQVFYDKYGNEVKPIFGTLLDHNMQPIGPKNGPIKVRLDIYGRPVLEKSLSEVLNNVQTAKYVSLLDKNGSPIIGPNGQRITRPLRGNRPNETPKYAALLDETKRPMVTTSGQPIMVHLDSLRVPIMDDSVIEALDGRLPQYAVLLDRQGGIVEAQRLNIDRMALQWETKPLMGILLDEHECPIKDLSSGSQLPIRVRLDYFQRPKYDQSVIEKLGGRHPEYVMMLDQTGAPILDKYACPIKSLALAQSEPLGPPVQALLLDQNEKPIVDPTEGIPVRTEVDILGRPLRDPTGGTAKFTMKQDQFGTPLKDAKGNYTISPILYYKPPQISRGKNLPDLVKPQWVRNTGSSGNVMQKLLADIHGAQLLGSNGNPILGQIGLPVELLVDQHGALCLNQEPTCTLHGASLLGKKGLPLLDGMGEEIKVHAPNGGSPTVMGMPVYRAESVPSVVVDKYGNMVDPKTGRPIMDIMTPTDLTTNQRLPSSINEDVQHAHHVNIGCINDIEYASNKPPPPMTAPIMDNTPTYDTPTYDAIPECHKCKKMIEDNALVIQIDRSEALWHSECFKCGACDQNLVDLFYFYHDESDDIYCGRDIAKIRGIPRCHACDELIFVKEYCLAEDNTYHVKHFCCFECDTPLAGREYVIGDERDRQPVCIPCYEHLKADKCRTCAKVISAHEQGANLNGDHFHADDRCFACRTCSTPLLGAKFLYRNGRLFCSAPCFQQQQQQQPTT